MIEVQGLSIPMQLGELCDATRTALLVYDMQAGITAQMKDGGHIVSKCASLIAAARAVGMRIAYSQHLSSPKKWMGATQFRTAMAWQKTTDPAAVRAPFLRGKPAAAIVKELEPTPDDLVVEKLAMSAFEGTALAYAMQDCKLTGVAICGIALEIGIEPTVRHATDLGFIPIVVTDACGAGNAEAGERALETMRFMGEAILTDAASFCAHCR
ncbi:MAG TPA: cysteine hydrolase [Steroidobacteraceae bacterium]